MASSSSAIADAVATDADANDDSGTYDAQDNKIEFPWANYTATVNDAVGKPSSKEADQSQYWENGERLVRPVDNDPGWWCFETEDGYFYRRQPGPGADFYVRIVLL